MELETKHNYADECQQQFTELDWTELVAVESKL
jgi:hypothetical protein